MCDVKCPVFGRGSYSFVDSISISHSSFSFEPVIFLPGLIAFHSYKKDEVFVDYRGKLVTKINAEQYCEIINIDFRVPSPFQGRTYGIMPRVSTGSHPNPLLPKQITSMLVRSHNF